MHRIRTVVAAFVALASAIVATLAVGGCPPPPVGQSLQEDSVAADAAARSVEQMIDNGASLEDAIRSLVQSLRRHPRVLAAAVDGDDPRTAWVFFRSGLEHVFQALDEDEELAVADAAGPPRVIIDDADARRAMPDRTSVENAGAQSKPRGPTAQPIPGLTPPWRTPAGRKALVANALSNCQPLQDVRPTIQAMLQDRGYEVDNRPADLDLFRNDNLTKYGVIFIEAHGGPRTATEAYSDDVARLFYNTVLELNRPYCGTPGGSQTLWTTTPVSSELNTQFKEDLECGRLKVRTAFIRRGRQRVPCVTTYAVTPDFIRHHNKNNFPDRTLVCFSACRSYDSNNQSEWTRLLGERGRDVHFVGWNRRAHYGRSARAFLNLFQLLTGSDRELRITSQSTGITYTLLARIVPPVGAQTLPDAMAALTGRGWDFDAGTGGHLIWTPGATSNDNHVLILTPDVQDYLLDQTGQTALIAQCRDNAELRIDHGQQQAGFTTFNIGAFGSVALADGLISGVGGWRFNVPIGAVGPLTLSQDARHGPPHDMLTWTPSFVVTGTGDHNLSYTVTYRMRARAIATPRWRTGQRGALIWNRPTGGFSARFDSGGSVVSWSAQGTETIGNLRYDSTGGNVQNISFVDQGTVYRANFDSMDGNVARVDFTANVNLAYTETVTDTTTGTSTVTTKSLPVDGVRVDSITLLGDWTLQGGTQTVTLSDGRGATVRWNDATPTPAYNADTMRR